MSHAVAVAHGSFGRAAYYRLDKPIIPHAHREGHLVFGLTDAIAGVCVGGTDVTVDLGTAAAVSPWEAHSFDPGASAAPFPCLVLYIKPLWFLENERLAEFILSFGSPKVRVGAELGRLVARMAAQMTDGAEECDIDPLLFDITRLSYLESWADGHRPDGSRRGAFNDYRVRKSLKILRESVGEEVDMESVARAVGLSRPHFFKLFKQQMGITPNLFLNTLRSERAIETLIGSDRTVADIAEDLGFASQASFSRFFTSNVGIPPSEYRRVAHRT